MEEVDITGEYPTAPDHSKANWNLKGVKSNIDGNRRDQSGTTHNDSTVRGVAGRTSKISQIASK